MKPYLPFRHENERNMLNNLHPVIRFILPFLLVIPFLIFNDLYLIITIILVVFCINIAFKLHFIKIISRLRVLIPFLLN